MQWGWGQLVGGRDPFWFPVLPLPSSSLQSLLAFTLPYPSAIAAEGSAQGWHSREPLWQPCTLWGPWRREKGVEQVEPLLRGSWTEL